MSENSQVTKAAGVVSAATFLSRILGYVRDMVVAAVFGAGFYSDAFIAAFRIPNLLRRLFGEGSLSIAFVPVFTEHLMRYGRDEAFDLARSAIRLLAGLMMMVSILGILMAPLIVKAIVPGFLSQPDKYQLTVQLTQIMFPYIFFISLVALCMGILNVLGHFAAPALAPTVLNISMIVAIGVGIWVTDDMTDRSLGLAIGVLVGGGLQLGLQVPFLIRKGIYFWRSAPWVHPGLKKTGRLMIPAIFGAAVYQINILIGTALASMLPGGSVSYLYFADRLVQFPLGIFAIAMATAVLPSFSRQAAANDLDALRNTFGYAMRLILFITFPAMAGLVVLAKPIISLLFMRGLFNIHDTYQTAVALYYYCIGLWAFASVRIVVSVCYSIQDTKTPVKMATISILVNIVLGIGFMPFLSHGGLALATSLASMVNLVLLLMVLRTKFGYLGLRSVGISGVKSIISSFVMGITTWSVANWIIPDHATGMGLLIGVVGCVIFGVICYIVSSKLLRSRELNEIFSIVSSRIGYRWHKTSSLETRK